MKISLIIMSVVNTILFILTGLGLTAASSFGGDSNAKSSAITLIIITGLALCVILPWILHSIGGRLAPLKASIISWIGFGLTILPIALLLFVGAFGSGSRDNLPLKEPTKIIRE